MSSPLGLYGGYKPESPEVRVLGQFSADKFSYRDQATNLRELNTAVGFISGMMRKMQRGIDTANQNILQQLQGLIRELIVLVGGGGDTGLDWGDLRYVLQAWGALFGFGNGSGGLNVPVDLFNAAWYFFANFIGFGGDFTELINTLLDNFIASVLDLFGEVPILGEALQQLAAVLKGSVDWIETQGAQLWAAIGDWGEDVGAWLAWLFDQINGWGADVFAWLLWIFERISHLTAPFWAGLEQLSNGAQDAIDDWLGGVGNALSNFFPWAKGVRDDASIALDPANPAVVALDGRISTLETGGHGWTDNMNNRSSIGPNYTVIGTDHFAFDTGNTRINSGGTLSAAIYSADSFATAQNYFQATLYFASGITGTMVLVSMSDTTMTNFVGIRVTSAIGSRTARIVTGTSSTSITNRGASISHAWRNGDVIGIGYDPATETYVMYINNVAVDSWTDTGSAIVDTSTNRSTGFITCHNGAIGPSIDETAAYDWAA